MATEWNRFTLDLKALGLYLFKFCSMLSIWIKFTLQKELQNFITNNVFTGLVPITESDQ